MIYVDGTTLIALGALNELELLTNFNQELVIPEEVLKEVRTEPAKTNISRFTETNNTTLMESTQDTYIEGAMDILGEEEVNGDTAIIAGVLAHQDESISVISDDKRVRTISQGLGANVTGTIGVIIKAVSTELTQQEGKELVKEIDRQGLHMTAELREKANELIEETEK